MNAGDTLILFCSVYEHEPGSINHPEKQGLLVLFCNSQNGIDGSTANGTLALQSWFAILHGNLLGVLHLTFSLRMVDARITPTTANPKPCMTVSGHTAFQCMVIDA